MRRILVAAAALLGDPPILMFDEPVNGLDPEGVYWIRGFLRRLAAEGRGSAKTGEKTAPLAGAGEAAFVQANKLEPQPGSVYDISFVRLLKGNVMAQITAWKKGASADALAKAAAKHVAAKLP